MRVSVRPFVVERPRVHVSERTEHRENPVELPSERLGANPDPPLHATETSLDLARTHRPPFVLRPFGASPAWMRSGEFLQTRCLPLDLGIGPRPCVGFLRVLMSSATSLAATSRRNRGLRTLPDFGSGILVST